MQEMTNKAVEHTDFIFSVTVEKSPLLVVILCVVVLAFAVFVAWRITKGKRQQI